MAPKTKKVMKAPGKTRKPEKMERPIPMPDNAKKTLLLKHNAYDKHPCADSLADKDKHNDENVVAYLAFTPLDMSWKNPVRCIKKAWYKDGLYIPLKLDPGAAMEAALNNSENWKVKSTARTFSTQWSILQLTLEPDQLTRAFKAGLIRWSKDKEGYEWWGDLDKNYGDCIKWDNYVLKPRLLWEVAE